MTAARARKPKPLRMLELCAGLGAMSYVWTRVLGQELAGLVEIDEFCRALYAQNFPGVPVRADIRSVWGYDFGHVDVVCAGFPCQPTSHAGKRRGQEDPRWLWPQVLRVVQVYEPAWVLLENVPGLLTLGISDVLRDLDATGYEYWPVVFPAEAAGAPHIRERVFIVAHANHRQCFRPEQSLRARGVPPCACGEAERAVGDTHGSGMEGDRPEGTVGNAARADVADTSSERERSADHEANPVATSRKARLVPGRRGQLLAHPEREQCDGLASLRERNERDRQDTGRPQSTDDASARPTGGRGTGGVEPRVGRIVDGLSAWMDGVKWPAGRGAEQYEWEAPRTLSRAESKADPYRTERVKALGNAIVPQQVAPLLAAICAAALMEREGWLE